MIQEYTKSTKAKFHATNACLCLIASAVFGCGSDSTGTGSFDGGSSGIDIYYQNDGSYDAESELGCKTDMECKGDRICDNGRCVSLGADAGARDIGANDVNDDDTFINYQDANYRDSNVDEEYDGSSSDGGIYDGSDTNVNGDENTVLDGGVSDVGVTSDVGVATPDTLWKKSFQCDVYQMARDSNDNILFFCLKNDPITIGSIYLLSKDGTVIWSYELPEGAICVRPQLLTNGNFVIDADTRVLTFSKSGYLWEYDVKQPIITSVRELSDHSIIYMRYDGALDQIFVDALDLTGKLIWSKPFDDPGSQPPTFMMAVTNAGFYVGQNGYIDSFSNIGVAKWKTDVNNPILSPVANSSGEIVVAYGDTRVGMALIKADGNIIWQKDLSSLISGYQFVDPVVSTTDDTVYFGPSYPISNPNMNKIVAVGHDGAIKWSNKMDQAIFNLSAVGGGQLLVSIEGGQVQSIQSDGTTGWKYQLDKRNRLPVLELSDGSYVIASMDQYIYRIKMK